MPQLMDALLDAYVRIAGGWPTVDSRNPETAAVRFVCAALRAYSNQITGELASAFRPSKLRLSPEAVVERVYASTLVTSLREARRPRK